MSCPEVRFGQSIAFNEPEASIHVDLLQPLAQLIGEASQFSQI